MPVMEYSIQKLNPKLSHTHTHPWEKPRGRDCMHVDQVGRPSRGGVLHGLQRLELSALGLQRLPGAIVPLQQLTHLCLAGNRLVALPVGGPWLVSLGYVNMSMMYTATLGTCPAFKRHCVCYARGLS